MVKRDRKREVVLAEHQDRFLVALHADGMLGVIGSDETLSRIGIGHHVSGLDDISGVTTEQLNEVSRFTRFCRSSQCRRRILGRLEGLLGRCSRNCQNQHGGRDQARGPTPIRSRRKKRCHGHIPDRI